MSALDTYLKSRPDRCSGCGWHPPTQGHGPECAPVAPALTKTTALAAVNDAAPAPDRAVIDAAILRVARRGGAFSANDVRELLPEVGPLMGARFNALARRGLIERVGYVPSTKGNTHGHPVAEWRAAS